MNQLFNPEYIAISIRREGEGEHCRQQESIFGWLGLAMYEKKNQMNTLEGYKGNLLHSSLQLQLWSNECVGRASF